ncbi:MAG: hypothetical protein QOI12_2634 [Alphaproteobacteria bacterium]|jgi:tripartite-type tricarboxylate transporter receptor subunit TctC|nr:hypothetical protein [Alphaproteobacteria bacterium]
MLRSWPLLALVLAVAPACAHADDGAAAFYKGKTLQIVNPFGEGGRNGTIARLLAEHLARHIPGTPNGISQFMPGAGGLRQMNYLYNAAPKDGTVVGLMYDNMPTVQVLEPDDNLKFDVRRLGALGSLSKGEAGVFGIHKRAGIATMDDARQKPAVIGAVGVASAQYYLPNIFNRLFGTQFKIIPGFKDTAEIYLALERGEVDGWYGGYEVMQELRPQWLAEQQFNWLAQLNDARSPQLPDVPLLQELAQTPVDQAAFRFLALARAPGKVLIVPPDVPPERLTTLRIAFEAMVRDRAFIVAISRTMQAPDPRTWQEAERLMRETIDTPPEIVRHVRDLIRVGNR